MHVRLKEMWAELVNFEQKHIHMQTYNKIMLYFWLVAGVVSLLVVSFNCITIGVDKWGFYFTMPTIAFMMFFFKRMMMRRMDKHLEYLKTVKEEESKKA